MFGVIIDSLIEAIDSCFDIFYDFVLFRGDTTVWDMFIFFFLILTFARFALVPFIGRGISVADNYSSDLAKKTDKQTRAEKYLSKKVDNIDLL